MVTTPDRREDLAYKMEEIFDKRGDLWGYKYYFSDRETRIMRPKRDENRKDFRKRVFEQMLRDRFRV